MKMERHQFNYNVLASYRGEIVFICSTNELLISLFLTMCCQRLKFRKSDLHGCVLPDGQVLVYPLKQR